MLSLGKHEFELVFARHTDWVKLLSAHALCTPNLAHLADRLWRGLTWLVVLSLVLQSAAPALAYTPAPHPSQTAAPAAWSPPPASNIYRPLAQINDCPAPSSSTGLPSGIKVYDSDSSGTECDDNCVCSKNGQPLPEIQLPFYQHAITTTVRLTPDTKRFLVCSKGDDNAHIYLNLLVNAKAAYPHASLKLICMSGACAQGNHNFSIENKGYPPYFWEWVYDRPLQSPQPCQRHQAVFEENVWLPQGRYEISLFAQAWHGCYEDEHGNGEREYEYFATFGPPRTIQPRNLAPEDACLANNPDPYALDPVNVSSGNFTHQEIDFNIPTLGLPLVFERSYNQYP